MRYGSGAFYEAVLELALGTMGCQANTRRSQGPNACHLGGNPVPTYAYACKDCGHAFDIQQSFSDNSLTVCPECRGTLRKKFNSVGVVFKGSGFYRTDSRSTSSSIPAAASTGASDSSAAPAQSTAASSTSSSSSAATPSKSPAPAGAAN